MRVVDLITIAAIAVIAFLIVRDMVKKHKAVRDAACHRSAIWNNAWHRY